MQENNFICLLGFNILQHIEKLDSQSVKPSKTLKIEKCVTL